MTLRRMFVIVLMLLPLSGSCLFAQTVETDNIPDELLYTISFGPFAQSYVLDGSMNPFYLRGDFDGDGKPDYAFWVKSKKTGETGIAIWLSSRHNFVILGAGTPFKASVSSVTNLDFLNRWQVYGKRPVERGVEAGPPPHLIGEAILVEKSESASGLIYWSGKSFAWYQQGD